MWYRIDSGNGVPIYEQIARQVKFAVAHGGLRVGDLIPSVRELAQTLAVNPNTVARAYRDLQADGIVEPLRGEGLRIARNAVDRCRKDRQKLLKERLKGAILECRQSGLDPAEIRALIQDVLQETSPTGATK
jgi:GntR family transcriptional regulator